MRLFSPDRAVGIFRGFSEGGLEFHADLVLPYRSELQSAPMHGQFLVVQLEDENEAVLGRITSISSEGRLTSPAGEDYGIRALAEGREIPDDLLRQYLKYRVSMRVLGVLRVVGSRLVFAASHRRLPHVGSRVAFLSDEVLREVAGHNLEEGAELGHLALGEFIYAAGDPRLEPAPWMQVRAPLVVPRFRVRDLVARRTFVFARAGFGKSNLVKLLFARLYSTTPTVEKRAGRRVPVGTIIFDPDGEYFWPDDKNRPGLCDVPELEDKVVVFTPKEGPSPFYSSFVAGGIKLDIRRLRPGDVISIALPPEKQEQQNIRKLKGMNDHDWHQLVDLVHREGNAADGETVKRLLRLDPGQDAEMVAARANLTTITRVLHDPSSQLLDMLITALRKGKICIVDVSQMRGTPGLVLSGLILRRIFAHNQEEFTKARPRTIPVIAVLEEAQSVLGSRGSSGEGPYVAWVKEGRKYDLGAVLITQQPGAISTEILSQGDNWFAFHLLSAGDLVAIKRANAHFSEDILSSLLNEPIPGHGVFWSSVSGKPYPIPIRVMSFEAEYRARDPEHCLPAVRTAASALRELFERELASRRAVATPERAAAGSSRKGQQAWSRSAPLSRPAAAQEDVDEPEDVLETYIQSAIRALREDSGFRGAVCTIGMPWRGVTERLKEHLPRMMSDRHNVAYYNVSRAMDEIFGKKKWRVERRPSKSLPGKLTAWIVADPEEP
jgi:DNA helicase HerA-like ATPase